MSREHPVALNPITIDTDSHRSTKAGFCTESGLMSNLILEEGIDTDDTYTFIYPMKLNYPASIIVKAQGVFELRNAQPWLENATVWYQDKPPRSGGSFFVTIMEGVKVTAPDGTVTIVQILD